MSVVVAGSSSVESSQASASGSGLLSSLLRACLRSSFVACEGFRRVELRCRVELSAE